MPSILQRTSRTAWIGLNVHHFTNYDHEHSLLAPYSENNLSSLLNSIIQSTSTINPTATTAPVLESTSTSDFCMHLFLSEV